MFVIADLPPAEQERVVCSIISAVKYELPANIVLAVAGQEGGRPGQWMKNKNGTYDVGPMQFNTGYLADLSKYGITAQDVEKSGCYSYELAAWRIRSHVLNDKGDLWTRVANYHSRTPQHNAIYRQKIMQRAIKWADWLNERFSTYNVSQEAVTNKNKASAIPESKAVSTAEGKTQASLQEPTTNRARSHMQTSYTPRTITAKQQ